MDRDAVVAPAAADEPTRRSRASFEEFYRSEYPVTLAVVIALRGRRVGPEEVAQEAFLRAYRDWGTVAAMEHPERWVRRVAVNLATSRWRRIGSEARALTRVGRSPDRSEAAVERVDGADRFWRAVRQLPAQQARAVALRYAADLTVEDVAQVLDRSPGTVKSTLHAARQRLATLLEAEEEAGR